MLAGSYLGVIFGAKRCDLIGPRQIYKIHTFFVLAAKLCAVGMAASTPRSKVDATEYKKFVASRMEGATVSENTGVMRSSAESDVLRRVTRMEIQRDITFVERTFERHE